jgi:hypothetical protein
MFFFFFTFVLYSPAYTKQRNIELFTHFGAPVFYYLV